MNRMEEFNKIKEIITNNFSSADFGLFFTRNIVGDRMMNLFTGKYFSIDICYSWAYFEVFGATREEWDELMRLYNDLKEKAE